MPGPVRPLASGAWGRRMGHWPHPTTTASKLHRHVDRPLSTLFSMEATLAEPDALAMLNKATSELPKAEQWNAALGVLQELLRANNGKASSFAVREALEKRGIPNARELVVQLKYFDFDSCTDAGRPPFRWYSHAASFFTEERYRGLQSEQAVEADQAARTVSEAPPTEEEIAEVEEVRQRPRNRQEESRLGTYVLSALENIYQTDFSPEDAPFVFDVHNARAGSGWENVDLLAVHWRTPAVVEIVAVEVKLDFTARLVQQARNYARFADRVWVAVPILAEAADAATALREFDPLLFEHIVDEGLGILACRRRPGKSYEVLPVQWPKRLRPDPVEKEAFIDRYREQFEEAVVVARRDLKRYPVLAR